MFASIAAIIKAIIATLMAIILSLFGPFHDDPKPGAYDLLTCVPRVHYEPGVAYPEMCPTEVSITAGTINDQDPIWPGLTAPIRVNIRQESPYSSTDLTLTIAAPCAPIVGTFSTSGAQLKALDLQYGEPACSYPMDWMGPLPETILFDFFADPMTVTRADDGVHLTNSQGFLVLEDL